MKKILFTVIAVALASCSGGVVKNGLQPAEGERELEIARVIEAADFSAIMNPAVVCGFYSGGIFYMQNRSEKVLLHLKDFEGKEIRTLEFSKGKGPGELLFPGSVRVHDDMIYVYDQVAYRVNVYDIEGEYVNEVLIKESLGYPHVFEVAPEGFVFNGGMQTRLAVIDRETGDLRVNLKYEKVEMPDNGVLFKGGVLACNSENGDVYLGYFNAPFTIEAYDIGGVKKLTIAKKAERNYREVVWDNSMGMSFPEGDMMVPAMKYYDGKLYVSSVNGYEITSDGFQSQDYPFFIHVFDTETGKYVSKFKIKGVDKSPGMGIVGVNDQYIMLLAGAEDLERLMPQSDAATAFILLKK